jgi:hypothetical protein
MALVIAMFVAHVPFFVWMMREWHEQMKEDRDLH